MPDPLAAATDVADIWRPLSTSETEQVENLIVKASALLRAKVPFDVDERLGLFTTDPTNVDALDPVVVASVVAGIVKRVMVNRDSVVSKTETTGPYSQSQTFVVRGAGDVDLGTLVVLPADLDALRPRLGFQKPFTIRTRPPRQHPGRARDVPVW